MAWQWNSYPSPDALHLTLPFYNQLILQHGYSMKLYFIHKRPKAFTVKQKAATERFSTLLLAEEWKLQGLLANVWPQTCRKVASGTESDTAFLWRNTLCQVKLRLIFQSRLCLRHFTPCYRADWGIDFKQPPTVWWNISVNREIVRLSRQSMNVNWKAPGLNTK